MERLSEAVGATIVVDDSPFEAELATSLVEGAEVVSELDAGILDSAVA